MIIWNIIINDYNIVIWNVIVNDYNMEYTHQYHNHLIKRSFRLILSATKYKSVTLEARRGEIAVCQWKVVILCTRHAWCLWLSPGGWDSTLRRLENSLQTCATLLPFAQRMAVRQHLSYLLFLLFPVWTLSFGERLTFLHEPGSSSRLDKPGKQHHVSSNSRFDLHSPTAVYRCVRKQHGHFFVYTTVVLGQPAACLRGCAMMYAFADRVKPMCHSEGSEK